MVFRLPVSAANGFALHLVAAGQMCRRSAVSGHCSSQSVAPFAKNVGVVRADRNSDRLSKRFSHLQSDFGYIGVDPLERMLLLCHKLCTRLRVGQLGVQFERDDQLNTVAPIYLLLLLVNADAHHYRRDADARERR